MREAVIPAYMGLVTQIDDQIGRLITYLEDRAKRRKRGANATGRDFCFSVFTSLAPHFSSLRVLRPRHDDIDPLCCLAADRFCRNQTYFPGQSQRNLGCFSTFLTGILLELDLAILVGVLLSNSVFLLKSANPIVSVGAPTEVAGRRVFMNAHAYDLDQCPQIVAMRLDGPLYFAPVEHVAAEFAKLEALTAAVKNASDDICATCKLRLFHACAGKPKKDL
ncbi:MAG: hypothetical protein ACSHW1_16725 [Yoonia sp.]|uniref:hypothetical protein n=1 Tax=Yoonia sp. TaxID=2212373 RepID=UPI003EF64F4F